MNLSNDFDLSIVIPHYNSSSLLINLINTIPCQNKNIEIIIVDDKSDITHVKKVEFFLFNNSFERLIFIKNDTNLKGAGVCRNIGLSNAKGKWVLFADADDYFTDNFYFIVEPYFKTTNDVVFFTPTSVYIDTKNIAFRHIHYAEVIYNYTKFYDKSSELNLRYNMSSPWSKLISRKFINENRIKFDEILASNDVLFSLKVGQFMKLFDTSKDVIYVITRNYGSLTADISEHVFDIRFNVFIKRHLYLKKILTNDELKLLYFNYRIMFLKSFRYGLVKPIKVARVFYDNNINIYDKKFLNPFLLLRKLIKYFNNNESKYKSLL